MYFIRGLRPLNNAHVVTILFAAFITFQIKSIQKEKERKKERKRERKKNLAYCRENNIAIVQELLM